MSSLAMFLSVSLFLLLLQLKKKKKEKRVCFFSAHATPLKARDPRWL